LLRAPSAPSTSSTLGSRPRFAAAADADLDAVDRLVEEWRVAVLAGRAEAEGFGSWLNTPSKVAQVAAVRAYAKDRRQRDLDEGTLVASLCPGLIDTDASRPWFEDMSTAQTTAEAAVWPVELALEKPDVAAWHGELVQFGRVLPWETGGSVPQRVAG
jgi:carbonyl reductase 1